MYTAVIHRSAYQCANVDVYVRRALELSGRGVSRSVADRTLAHSNFTRVIQVARYRISDSQNHEPSPEAGFKSASEAWAHAKSAGPITIEMNDLRDCIDCKVS